MQGKISGMSKLKQMFAYYAAVLTGLLVAGVIAWFAL